VTLVERSAVRVHRRHDPEFNACWHVDTLEHPGDGRARVFVAVDTADDQHPGAIDVTASDHFEWAVENAAAELDRNPGGHS